MIRTLTSAVTTGRKGDYDRIKSPMENGIVLIVIVFMEGGKSQMFSR